MLKGSILRQAETWGYIFLMVVAVFLRVGWLHLAGFGFDQAYVSALALGMARQGKIPLVGMPSSVGLPNFPAAAWTFALFYRFSTDPLVVTGIVAVLNGIGALGLGWLARHQWGKSAGLAAAALWATSPWAIFFSRSIWAQDLLPPLAILWACCGVQATHTGRKGWLVGHIFLAGLAPQIHYAGIVLWPATLWLICRHRLWRRPWGLLAGAGSALATAVPFGYAVWPLRHTLLAQIEQLSHGALQADLLPWRQLAHMGLGIHWQILTASQNLTWPWWAQILGFISQGILALGFVLGFLLLLWNAFPRRSQSALAIFILLWAFAAPLLFTVRRAEVYHHYLLAAFPALSLIAAYAVGILERQRLGLWPLSLLLIAGAIQGGLWGYTITTMANQAESISHALQWPRAVVRSLEGSRPIVIYADCEKAETCEQAAIWQVFLWGREHRVIDAHQAFLIPGEAEAQGAYLILTPPVAPQALAFANTLGWQTALWRYRISNGGQGPYQILEVPPTWRDALRLWWPTKHLTLATGAQIRAWQAEIQDQRMVFTSLWYIVSPIPPKHHQQFTHFYVNNKKIAGQDGSVSIAAWRPGDWLAIQAQFHLPPDARTLHFETGMYSWPEMERAAILEEPENSERVIRLGPIMLP